MKKQFDFFFFLIVISLLAIGLIMVFSSSSEAARVQYDDAYYFIKRQMMWAAVSLVSMFAMANFNYKRLQKMAIPLLILAIITLIAVLFIGKEVNGGKRWISLGFVQFQPSEVAKIAVIIFMASSLSVNYKNLKKFFTGLIPYLCILVLFAGLIMLEPHFSATIVIVLVAVIILITAGARMWHFFWLGVPVASALAILVATSEYRMQRVTAFLDPFKDKLGDGWQIIQSLYAIGSGGLFGLGLGRSRQKFLYIPEPQNDFIFSILCEELGLIGAATVIILFALLI
ncbi:MAG: FtsW/RodA/SpoVE family cell cycle protein [Clostridiales bacterium]|jgi:cell division protein FtsW|nr:FtsW/RodA/SpoVE family cell cycle protein [Clostridiales bacterium]